MFCNTKILNSDTPQLTDFKLHQNESKTRHLNLYFFDIRTQEVQDTDFYLKHPNKDMLLRFGKSECLVVDLYLKIIYCDTNMDELGQ